MRHTSFQHSSTHHYQGYIVSPSAHRLPDGSFTANLHLERLTSDSIERRYDFYALNYFDDEADALTHSCQWAHRWVDTRG
jgi:hypothetical protein